jgi:hypothetical protein
MTASSLHRVARDDAIASFADQTARGDFSAAEDSLRSALVSELLLASYRDNLDLSERHHYVDLAKELVDEEWACDAGGAPS